jgi:hypothetical protein
MLLPLTQLTTVSNRRFSVPYPQYTQCRQDQGSMAPPCWTQAALQEVSSASTHQPQLLQLLQHAVCQLLHANQKRRRSSPGCLLKRQWLHPRTAQLQMLQAAQAGHHLQQIRHCTAAELVQLQHLQLLHT